MTDADRIERLTDLLGQARGQADRAQRERDALRRTITVALAALQRARDDFAVLERVDAFDDAQRAIDRVTEDL